MIRLVELFEALQCREIRLSGDIDNCTTTDNMRPRLVVNRAEGRAVPSIGPFELTEAEVIGLEFLRQEDERQLRKTELHATWSGRVLTVKVKKLLFGTHGDIADIESRSSQIAQ